MKVRRWLARLVIAPALLLATSWQVAAESLTVVSWGGAYEQATRKAVLEPFAQESGIDVLVEVYNGGLAQVRAQVETGNVHWDLVDLELADVILGCDEGLLELIEPEDLAPAADGRPTVEDFLPSTITECGGAFVIYSTVYAYNTQSFPDDKPTTMADLFDTEKFPGRRGLRRAAQANLEFALMADGVPISEVYATLGTAAGMARAFRKLDTIKDDIVWWETGAQPPQMLADREVVMSTAYNGRIFDATVMEKQSFVIVWDGQMLDTTGWAIVTGTRHLDAARRFLTYASRPDRQADLSHYISYSPGRLSGATLIDRHLATGMDMKPHVPTSDQNMARALPINSEWWSDHADEVNERFSAWLAR